MPLYSGRGSKTSDMRNGVGSSDMPIGERSKLSYFLATTSIKQLVLTIVKIRGGGGGPPAPDTHDPDIHPVRIFSENWTGSTQTQTQLRQQPLS